TGFDTHTNNFNRLSNQLLPSVDEALAGLVTDLDQRGLLETTVVCCVGEFARTPRINRQAGRDHWSRSMAAFLAGGGLQKGHVYGATDLRGQAPTTQPHSPDDLAAFFVHQLTGSRDLHLTLPSGRRVPAWKNGTIIPGVSM
ncbi:MAG: DUF1501 domain-containing protein, partial [Planctomycetaceae bacterium]|nr:DUF1501 domain-containing protein [Planctomycetaceae bacterium]